MKETSFIEKSELEKFLEDNVGSEFADRLRSVFADIDDGERLDEDRVKGVINRAIDTASLLDVLDEEKWDGLEILNDEKKKFFVEQKARVVNEAFEGDLVIDTQDANIYELFEKDVEVTTTPKKGEINGVMYKKRLIIRRVREDGRLVYRALGKEALLGEFVNRVREIQGTKARGILKDTVYLDRDMKPVAEEYIDSLREEQREIVSRSRGLRELNKNMKELEKIEENIKLVRENKSFKIRWQSFRRTWSNYIRRLMKFAWANKGKVGGAISSILVGVAVSI